MSQEKLVQFNAELQALLDRYLYDLKVEWEYTKQGPVGQIVAKDRIPAPAQPATTPVPQATQTQSQTQTQSTKPNA